MGTLELYKWMWNLGKCTAVQCIQLPGNNNDLQERGFNSGEMIMLVMIEMIHNQVNSVYR
jgi:hypothetical protein